MALVKCAECNNLVSNKATKCPHCGYTPKGICKNCQSFQREEYFSCGRCGATDNEFVKEYKSVCPAVIKKSILDFRFR